MWSPLIRRQAADWYSTWWAAQGFFLTELPSRQWAPTQPLLMHEITPPQAWDLKNIKSAKISFQKVPLNSFLQAHKVPLSNSLAFQQTAPSPFVISHEFAGMKLGCPVSSFPDTALCPSWNGFIEKNFFRHDGCVFLILLLVYCSDTHFLLMISAILLGHCMNIDPVFIV